VSHDGVVVMPEPGIPGEDGALLRFLDVRLERDQAVLAGGLEYFVEHLQQFPIRLLVERVGLEQAQKGADRGLHHRGGIGDDERPEAGAADNHELRRLPQHLEAAVVRRISDDDAGKDNHQSDNLKHVDDVGRRESARGAGRADLTPRLSTRATSFLSAGERA
jgi:hypothetical protein